MSSGWNWCNFRLGTCSFPKDAHGLAKFDGSALYEHADPRQGNTQNGVHLFSTMQK